MTTTELIKILKDNECGGISHKPREISLTINGKYMSNPQIALSSTGDGICGAEIALDVNGEFLTEQKPCEDCISRQAAIKNVAQIAKALAKSDKQKSLCGRIIFMLEHMSEVSE